MLSIDALAAFVRRVEASLTAAQHAAARERETRRLGLDEATWSAIARGPLDLDLVRRLHVAITGDQTSVRRTLRDGQYTLAPAQPGKLRTKPQALRIGDHVEAAWDQGVLKRGLVELLREIAPALAQAPIRETARVLWAVSRAQPFTGHNERTGLALAAWCLRRAGLPVIPVLAIERDPAYGTALATATRDDRSALEQYLGDAVWAEALALAEWLAPVPPPEPARWTLKDEHEALASARRDVPRIAPAELEAFARSASEVLVAELRARVGVDLEIGGECWLASHAERLQEAWDSAARGRAICPHEPILVVRWQVAAELGLEAKLILGAAGRGVTGAVSAQLALELAAVPAERGSRAMLLVPEEPAAARRDRLTTWLASALPDLLAHAPLRL